MAASKTTVAEQLITENLDVWSTAIKSRASVGRGSSKKIDLYGVNKLRELILELAVRGLLVPQDPNDEPASVLLEKIAAEKDQLIKDKKIKKQKPLSVIGDDEKPFEIPQDWEWVKVGEISNLKGGYAYKSKEFLGESEYQLIRMGNIRPNLFRLNVNSVFITPEMADSTREYEILSGDILLTMTGTKGKRDYLYSLLVQDEDLVKRKLFLNQRLCISRALKTDGAYINLAMKVGSLLDLIYGKSTGTANQANIGMEAISNWVVPFPGLLEQKRIVTKVDELMALCDQLEQQQESSLSAHQTLVATLLAALTSDTGNITHKAGAKNVTASFESAWARIEQHFDTLFTTEASIEQLKQTILELAVMGKLVPQDPNDESASVLLEKIAAEKEQLIKDKKMKKQKPLPPIEDEEKEYALPVGWEWIRLQELVTLLGDGLHGTPNYDDTGSYYFINGNNLDDGVINIKPETKKVSAEEYLKYKKNLNGRTVLVSINGTLGNVAFFNNEPVMLGKSACYFNLSLDLNKLFFKRLIEAPYFLNYAFSSATGSTIKNLGLKTMNALPIALPPLEEQTRIVAKIDELMALCYTLKTRIRESQATQFHLADAMAEQALN